jgi:hypothetical protein
MTPLACIGAFARAPISRSVAMQHTKRGLHYVALRSLAFAAARSLKKPEPAIGMSKLPDSGFHSIKPQKPMQLQSA